MTYAKFLKRRWWLLVLVPALALVASYFLTRTMEEEYTAKAKVVVLNRAPTPVPGVEETREPALPGPNELVVEPRFVATYLELVERRAVIERAAAALQFSGTPDQLADRVAVTNPSETQLIEITGKDGEPEAAAAIANAVAAAFIEVSAPEIGASDALVLAEAATAPESPSSPKVINNMALAGILALVGAVALGLLLERWDQTVKSVEDLEALPIAALGAIPRTRAKRRGQAWSDQKDSPLGEAFRKLRADLRNDGYGVAYHSLLVTSETQRAGKSLIAANLAVAFAKVGLKVVLVDLNLRLPVQHRVFDVSNEVGAGNYLEGAARKPRNFGVKTAFANLSVLPAGVTTMNPSDLLASPRLGELIKAIQAQADVVIIDGPSVASSSDAVALSSKIDASLLVARAGKTRLWELAAAADRLDAAGSRLVGVVINGARRIKRSSRASTRLPHPARKLALEEQELNPAPHLAHLSYSNGTSNGNGASVTGGQIVSRRSGARAREYDENSPSHQL